MPKADALSNKPRREVFQDENTEAMTASLQFATLKGCAAAGGSANKGLKIFERTFLRSLYVKHGARDQPLPIASLVSENRPIP
jgi:hypothetical protein